MKALVIACALLFSNTSLAESLSEAPSALASELSVISVQQLAQLVGTSAGLTVAAVQVGAGSGLVVLQAGSEGARFSLQVPAEIAGSLAQCLGEAVQLTVDSAGTALSVRGKMIAYLLNDESAEMTHQQAL